VAAKGEPCAVKRKEQRGDNHKTKSRKQIVLFCFVLISLAVEADLSLSLSLSLYIYISSSDIISLDSYLHVCTVHQ